MKFYIEDFFLTINEKKVLKKDYVFYYSFHPGLYAKICSINIVVNKDMEYELFLFFPEMNLKKFDRRKKVQRIFIQQKGLLPFEERKALKAIIDSDFSLKESYYNSKNTFGILDLTHIHCEINHKSNNYSIDLTPYSLDNKLFISPSEKQFINFIHLIENWLFKIRDFSMDLHTVN